MKVKAAFILLAPEVDYKVDRSVLETKVVTLTTVAVQNYEEAVVVAVELADQGINMIELCGGFGNEGVAMVSKATKGRAHVGVVKFDCHPGLDFKSGDELFN